MIFANWAHSTRKGAVLWSVGILLGWAAAIAVSITTSCAKQVPTAVSVEVATYAAELAGCRLKAKQDGGMPAYEACADAVDARYGRKP